MLGTIKLLGKIQTIVLFSALVTLSLFYSMQLLIMSNDEVPVQVEGITIDPVTIPTLGIKEVKTPPKPEPVEEPPEIPDDLIQDVFDITPTGPSFTYAGEVNEAEVFDYDLLGPADGSALPIARIEPEYPQRAAARGVEGYVIVEFDVSETGRVIDPRILGAEPSSVFDRAAIRAIEKWKYNPQIQNGKPVKMLNLRTRFSFNLRE